MYSTTKRELSLQSNANDSVRTAGYVKNLPRSSVISQLQRTADNSHQVHQLHSLSSIANSENQALMQFKTIVDHTSIDQNYFSNGDVSTQKMGVEMEAFLDPWNPLHGTESGAFTRHGLYLDPAYNEGSRGATALHLLNANLGGLAVDENLFPGHTNKNGQHLKSGETEVKNRLLALHEKDLRGHRVWYRVQFSPPPLLRPENFTSVNLSLQHCYIDEEDRPYLDMTKVRDDPNTDLDGIGWETNEVAAGVRRKDRQYIFENTQGNRATSVETITHPQDPRANAVRLHTHLANEDKDLLNFRTSIRQDT